MKTYSATEFKAKCLAILDHVNETGEPVQITKRGNIVAELRASYPKPKGLKAGFAKGDLKIIGDIDAPLDVEWEAMTATSIWPEESDAD